VGKDLASSNMFFLFVGIFAIIIIISTIVYSPNATNAATGDSDLARMVYGCIPQGQIVRCDPSSGEFSSLLTTGVVERVSTVNSTKSDPIEGVFGSALPVNGYRQEYLTIPNQLKLNSEIFSVSFWLKQDPAYVANSAIISHVNAEKNAGWSFQLNVTKVQTSIQFSVTNSDGKVFTVSTPIETGVFQNVVGTFDGEELKIYLNGYLVERNQFNGSYNANPDVPLNVGLNSYDYGRAWTGLLDELRYYDRVISDKEVQKLTDYGAYFQLYHASNDEGLIGYWSFDDGGLMDNSGNGNDGKIVLLAVSMVFSPDGKLFFSVRDAGEIKIMKPISTVLKEPFVRLQDRSTNAHQDILGITLDPDFPANHFVYAYVVVNDTDTGIIFSRVMRFTESENRAIDQKILIDNIPTRNGPLFAGGLVFGPDDKLYVATSYSDKIEKGHNSNLTGKVLRINRDGTIPDDNPIPNSPVYSGGHRSIFGIAFDNTTRMALIAENDVRGKDEINLLKKGGNYGFPGLTSPAVPYRLQADNISAIKPIRPYYVPITPTQAIFYGNNIPALKDKFLFVANGERSIYAIALNSNGSIREELAVRLPEARGHLVSIAKSPEGDIYIGGENLFKLKSIDMNRKKLTYFINVISTSDIEVTGVRANLTSKVLSIDFVNKNNGSLASTGQTSPTLQIKIPKAILSSIYDVTSEKYNKTSNGQDKVIENFKLKENMRVSNAGDTIIDIKLKSNIVEQDGDKILIKGVTSSLVQQPPPGTISIFR
jgi:glucose/arabinose dehydrogenase